MTNDKLVNFFLYKLNCLESLPKTMLIKAYRRPMLQEDVLINNNWRLIIILSGKRLHHYADGKQVISTNLKTGDILLVEPFAGVWCEEDQSYDMLSIVNTPSAIRFVSKQREKGVLMSNKADAILYGGQEELKCFQLLLEIFNHVSNRVTFPDVTPLLKFLWSECRIAINSSINVPQSGPQHLLGNIMIFISEHLTENLSCSRVASVFGVNANYVSQLFNRGMTCGVSDYVSKQRLELARELLKNSQMNVTEIADYCGFKQSNYFIRVFKKQYGYTPLTYRTSRNRKKKHTKSSS